MIAPGNQNTSLSFMRGGRLYQIVEGLDGYVGYRNGQVRARAGSRAEVAKILIDETYISRPMLNSAELLQNPTRVKLDSIERAT